MKGLLVFSMFSTSEFGRRKGPQPYLSLYQFYINNENYNGTGFNWQWSKKQFRFSFKFSVSDKRRCSGDNNLFRVWRSSDVQYANNRAGGFIKYFSIRQGETRKTQISTVHSQYCHIISKRTDIEVKST